MDNTMPILLVPGLVSLAADLRAGGPGAVAARPGDGRQSHPRRQYGRDRAADPGRGAAALRAGRAFDGRLHRLRDHAPGAGAGGEAGADQHPGAAGYAGGDRAPPRQDGAGAEPANITPCSTSCFRASCIRRGATMPSLRQLVHDMGDDVGVDAFIRQQTAVIGRPDSRPTLAGSSVRRWCCRATRTTPSRIRCRWRWPTAFTARNW